MLQNRAACRQWFVGVAHALAIICLCAPFSQARESYSHEAILSDWDRACLALHALADGINNPSGFDLHRAITADSKGMQPLTEAGVNAVASRLRAGRGQNGGVPIIRFQLKDVTEVDGTFDASVIWYMEAGRFLWDTTTTVRFVKRRQALLFESMPTELGVLEDLVNEHLSFLQSVSDWDSWPDPLGMPTDLESYYSSRLLKADTLSHDPCVLRLTETSSQANFDGHIIFSRPYGIEAFKYDELWSDEIDHEYIVISDANWDRAIAANQIRGTLGAYGSHGQEAYQFNNPSGVAFVPSNGYKWCIADNYNNRVSLYKVIAQPNEDSLAFLYHITGNFDGVPDVAADAFPSFDGIVTDGLVAVLDRGNCQVHFYNPGSNPLYEYSLFSQGTGINQLYRPSALCFGRNWDTEYPNHASRVIYVADAGNSRIIARTLSTIPKYYSTETAKLPSGVDLVLPENTYFASVDVDNYGYVYAIDGYNSRIYVFNHTLEYLLGVWGGNGTADTCLMYPRDFTVAKGLRWEDRNDSTLLDPIFLGDAFATEMFGDHTGIRKFILGADIAWSKCYYNFDDNADMIPDAVTCCWYQAGLAKSTRTVWYNGDLKALQSDSLNASDKQFQTYRFQAGDSSSGWVVFQVDIRNKYDNTFIKSIRDSIWVSRPQVTFFDPSGDVDCIFGTDDRWWGVTADIRKNYPSVTNLHFCWSSPEDELRIYFCEDTLTGEVSRCIHTIRDTVFFRLSDWSSVGPDNVTKAWCYLSVFDAEPGNCQWPLSATPIPLDTIPVSGTFYSCCRTATLGGCGDNPDQDDYMSICDNCPNEDNSGQENADGDTWGDDCDMCPQIAYQDATDYDCDSVPALQDNCDYTANTDQANNDGDTLGNVCDNCPDHWNDDQADWDCDNVGDSCDYCFYVPNSDNDPGACVCDGLKAREWAMEIGCVGKHRVNAVARLTDSSYVFVGTILTSTGNYIDSLLIIRTDRCGFAQWRKTIQRVSDYTNTTGGYSVAATSDGGFVVTGQTDQYWYLCKFDDQGDTSWCRTFEPYMGASVIEGKCWSVQQTQDGGFILAGQRKLDENAPYNGFLLKTNSDGVEQWSKTYENELFGTDMVLRDVKQTSDSGYVLAGYHYVSETSTRWDVIKTDDTGGVIWDEPAVYSKEPEILAAYSVDTTGNGGYIVAGQCNDNGKHQDLVRRLKSDGKPEWTYQVAPELGLSDTSVTWSVRLADDGTFVFCGDIYAILLGQYRYKTFVAKLNANGDSVWTRWIEQDRGVKAFDVESNSDGSCVIAGQTGAVYARTYIAKMAGIDSDGDGWGDVADNCPDSANPGQEDTDGDGIGDVCDPCPFVPDSLDGNRNCIVDTEECILRGDVDGNDSLDCMDVIYLLDYFWNEGPPPVNMEQADVDASGQVDPMDSTYLIDYFWNGGPPPVPCPDQQQIPTAPTASPSTDRVTRDERGRSRKDLLEK